MRFLALSVLVFGLGGAAVVSPQADDWGLSVIEPNADAVFVEPVAIIPRGEVVGDSCNKTKQVQAEAEFWFEKAGEKTKLIDSKAWVAKAGEASGFNFGISPQLTEGRGWVGVRVLDENGQVLDFKIHNFTVKKAPVPLPLPPVVAPAPSPVQKPVH